MVSSTRNCDAYDDEIRLWREDGWWIATDVETGLTTQGESRSEALDNLDDAVALHRGETGREPSDAELRETGIGPEDNTTGHQEPPRIAE